MTCNPSAFVKLAPELFDRDAEQSRAEILRRWSGAELVELLAAPGVDAPLWAARCLGLVGDWSTCEPLIARLGHPHPAVIEAVENALWMIWTRAGAPAAVERLHRATRWLRAADDRAACDELAALLDAEPYFAEAHHVYGIALQGVGELDAARDAFARAVRLNPYHYAAQANLGHIAVEREQYADALRHYRRALEIHPGLHDLREAIPMLERAVARRSVA